jgi:hypothetical protein
MAQETDRPVTQHVDFAIVFTEIYGQMDRVAPSPVQRLLGLNCRLTDFR